MKEGYRIDSKGIRVKVKSTHFLDLIDMDIVALYVPEGVKEVWCQNNQLTHLDLPEGVERVYCDNNQLTHLDLPEGVKWVWCDLLDNLQELEISHPETEIHVIL